MLLRTFNKFLKRHEVIVEKYNTTLRKLRFCIQWLSGAAISFVNLDYFSILSVDVGLNVLSLVTYLIDVRI